MTLAYEPHEQNGLTVQQECRARALDAVAYLIGAADSTINDTAPEVVVASIPAIRTLVLSLARLIEHGDQADQSTWPAHLRDDAPYQVCRGCGRKTWSVSEFGGECKMPQPSGGRCMGMFSPDVVRPESAADAFADLATARQRAIRDARGSDSGP